MTPDLSSVPISLRLANLGDNDFAYEVACKAIRPYAEQTFGIWQEAQVRHMLASSISIGATKIVVAGVKRAGILSVRELADHIQLDQVFLLPEHQGHGIGTELVRQILLRGKQLEVPVRLRVLRVNPAKHLYERMGFFVVAEESERFYMQSAP